MVRKTWPDTAHVSHRSQKPSKHAANLYNTLCPCKFLQIRFDPPHTHATPKANRKTTASASILHVASSRFLCLCLCFVMYSMLNENHNLAIAKHVHFPTHLATGGYAVAEGPAGEPPAPPDPDRPQHGSILRQVDSK